jgi:hypothetical protein
MLAHLTGILLRAERNRQQVSLANIRNRSMPSGPSLSVLKRQLAQAARGDHARSRALVAESASLEFRAPVSV